MGATMYENLSKYYPEVEDYRIYHAQCLYRGGMYDEALKVSQSI